MVDFEELYVKGSTKNKRKLAELAVTFAKSILFPRHRNVVVEVELIPDRVFHMTGSKVEEIEHARSLGLDVDDDNDSAPENVLDKGSLPDIEQRTRLHSTRQHHEYKTSASAWFARHPTQS